MNTTELINLANKYRPDLMEKTATCIKLLEQMAPDFVPEVMQDIKDITEAVSDKLAAPNFAGYGYALGGTLLAGLAGALSTDLYDAAKRKLTKGTNFKRIMEANPELKELDQKRLKSSFDLIHRYAPEFTADAIMGGSILKNVAELPGNEATIIKDLISSRKNLLESRGRQYNALSSSNIGGALNENDKKDDKEMEKYKSDLRAKNDEKKTEYEALLRDRLPKHGRR